MSNEKAQADSAPLLLLMSPDDNCLIARTTLAAGDVVPIEGAQVVLSQHIPLGYKVAPHALRVGEQVLRYGAIIGTVTVDVAPGAGSASRSALPIPRPRARSWP